MQKLESWFDKELWRSVHPVCVCVEGQRIMCLCASVTRLYDIWILIYERINVWSRQWVILSALYLENRVFLEHIFPSLTTDHDGQSDQEHLRFYCFGIGANMCWCNFCHPNSIRFSLWVVIIGTGWHNITGMQKNRSVWSCKHWRPSNRGSRLWRTWWLLPNTAEDMISGSVWNAFVMESLCCSIKVTLMQLNVSKFNKWNNLIVYN